MKNAILLHGSSSTPNSVWLPSIKKFLEEKGYSVWAPQLHHSDNPDLKEVLPLVLEKGDFNSETIIIGHSSGASLVLAILENIPTKIKKAVLVAGFARHLPNMAPRLILQNEYDWEKIKNSAENLIFINSDNDPYGCTAQAEGKYMQEHLGGELIITHDGHMGSEKFNQPYREFPLLEKLLAS